MADADAPKRRGRPALKAGESSMQVGLRLSASDYDRALTLAQKHRVSVSQLMRAALRIAIKKQRTLDEV